MSDFNDRPLMVGSIIGVRSFDVDALGRLGALTRRSIFLPGENVAECDLSGANLALRELAFRLSTMSGGVTTSGGVVPTSSFDVGRSASKPKRPHQVAGKGCSCGFYAYSDGTARHAGARAGSIVGLIEGYGVCTVGSRGFRAEKARLVALVAPRFARERSLIRRFAWVWWIVLATVSGAGGILAAVDKQWIHAAAQAAVVAADMWLLRQALRARRKPLVFDTVRRNYPDAEVYGSVKSALRAHPLPVNPVPNPETDEDFWTRSAS